MRLVYHCAVLFVALFLVTEVKAQERAVPVSHDLIAAMNDQDFLQYVDNLQQQNNKLVPADDATALFLLTRIMSLEIPAEHKEKLSNLIGAPEAPSKAGMQASPAPQQVTTPVAAPSAEEHPAVQTFITPVIPSEPHAEASTVPAQSEQTFLAIQEATAKSPTLSASEQARIAQETLEAAVKEFAKTKKKVDAFTINFMQKAYGGILPPEVSQALTGLYRTPKTVYELFAKLMGGAAHVDRYAQLKEFYLMFDSYGLLLKVLHDVQSQTVSLKTDQKLTMLFNSLISLDHAKIVPDHLYVSAIMDEQDVVIAGIYKGLLKDTLITPLAENYAVEDFVNELKTFMGRAKIGVEKSSEYEAFATQLKSWLTTTLFDELINQLEMLNNGQEKFVIKDLMIKNGSPAQARNSYLYKEVLKDLFTPLIDVLRVSGQSNPSAFEISKVMPAIEKCMTRLKKQLEQLPIPWVSQEKIDEQKTVIVHAVRTFLIDVIQNRLVHLYQAMHPQKLTPVKVSQPVMPVEPVYFTVQEPQVTAPAPTEAPISAAPVATPTPNAAPTPIVPAQAAPSGEIAALTPAAPVTPVAVVPEQVTPTPTPAPAQPQAPTMSVAPTAEQISPTPTPAPTPMTTSTPTTTPEPSSGSASPTNMPSVAH